MIPKDAAVIDFDNSFLNECPFCGEGYAEVKLTQYRSKEDRYKIICMSCGASSGEARHLNNAIKNWQRRS